MSSSQSEEPGRAASAAVAALLRTTSASLIERWKRRVLDDPAVPEANRLPSPALVDHMPTLLAELVLALDQRQHTSLTAEEIGRRVWHSPSSAEHATQRLDSGYTLPAVLRELSHFRGATIDHLHNLGVTLDSEATHLIHTAIDEAMTVAALEVERAARSSLASSEERAQILLDGVVDYAIFMLDLEGKIASWSSGAERILGWSADQVLGQNYRILFTEADRAAQKPESLLARVGAEGRGVAREHHVRTDGTSFPADIVISRLRDSRGVLRGYAEVAHDITESLRLEDSLRETQELLQSVIDRAPAVIYVKDRDGRYTLVNRRFGQIFDLSEDAILGKTDVELFTKHSLTELRANDAEVLRTNAPVEREETVVTNQGLRVYLSSKFPLRDEHGVAHAVGGISTDITERKEEEVRQSQLLQFRDRFVGIVAHDLREPINAISMAGQLLLRHVNIDEQSVSFIRRIISGAERMTRMVSELLDYARGDLGDGIPITRKEIDLTEVVSTSLSELRTAHPSWPIEVDVPAGVRATLDPDRISQVVTNLVGNAIHHGAPKRPITVRLRDLGTELELAVHSEGAPIPSELIPEIFKPFRSGPSAGGRKRAGLGLYIVERIAHAHGGYVHVSSTEEEGTSFTVSLPKSASAAT